MIGCRMRLDVLAPLHRRSIHAQLVIVLAVVPVIAVLVADWVAPIAVRESLREPGSDVADAAIAAVRIALAVTLAAVALATAAASMLLRGSMRSVVEELQVATDAIARGDLAHRIRPTRRDELGALARSIDSMAERLQRLEQARRRLLACVSHELRTPLTIVQGHAYSLSRSERDASRRERLELMQAEAMRLAGLVGDLVDASSIHAGGLRVRPSRADLVDVVRTHLVRHAGEAARRGITIEQRGRRRGAHADVDVDRFGQVLDNLLANATRHAPVDTVVQVFVDVGRDGDRIVEVVNRCAPIPPHVLESMFEPFAQGECGGSVGLGLAIARGIVDAHGGTITIDPDRAACGTACLAVRLPAPVGAARPVARRRVGSELPASNALAGAGR